MIALSLERINFKFLVSKMHLVMFSFQCVSAKILLIIIMNKYILIILIADHIVDKSPEKSWNIHNLFNLIKINIT